MNVQPEDATLTISQFGWLCQLSRKALRLYAERGILAPAWIDPDSGYRYYSRAQVPVARRIRLLRMMDMPLVAIAGVLEEWERDPLAAQRRIQAHVNASEKQFAAVVLAAKLIVAEITQEKELEMAFEMKNEEMATQVVVSIRRQITVPAFHEWIPQALRDLSDHIKDSGAKIGGDPLALYYGPVNEEDDGPVEICVPIAGSVLPKGDIKIRELTAHKAIQLRTYGEYNTYPKLLEMWNAVGRYVNEGNLEPDWSNDMTTYEIWHEDETMTIGWPVKAFAG